MSILKKETIDELNSMSDQFLHLAIAAKSDFYPAAHFRCAIFCSLCASMILYFIPWDFYDPIWYLYVQIPALLVGYFLAHNLKIKKLLTTNAEQREEVYQMALETYHQISPAHLQRRLLYLSLMEKRVELICLKDGDYKKEKETIKKLVKSLKKAKTQQIPSILKEFIPSFKDDAIFQEPMLESDLPERDVPEISTPTE